MEELDPEKAFAQVGRSGTWATLSMIGTEALLRTQQRRARMILDIDQSEYRDCPLLRRDRTNVVLVVDPQDLQNAFETAKSLYHDCEAGTSIHAHPRALSETPGSLFIVCGPNPETRTHKYRLPL